MDYDKLFKFFIVDDEVNTDSVTGKLITGLSHAIEARGYRVETGCSFRDARVAIDNEADIGCFLIDWDEDGHQFSTKEIIEYIRERGLETPIFLISEKHQLQDIGSDMLKEVRGYVYLQEDTADFIAKYVARAYHEYIDNLKTPFFGGMIDYVENGNEMWLAPGHNGGMFYRKSPTGKILFDYLGENFWRADFNFVPDLGDIFGHTGPYAQAEQDAAKIFNAERTYFVLNGTSTSNKMVDGALVQRGDLVLFDRNNHKSHHHSALIMNGGIPVYLPDDRNSFGMVGPIMWDALDEEYLRERIRQNPLVKDPEASEKKRPFRVAIIENCTYDGTIYDVDTIIEKIGHLCDYLFFDEAWGGFMRFHPLYTGRYGLHRDDLKPEDPGIVVTHSTHKQLAGMSQASQIHVKDSHLEGQNRHLNHKRLNEVYMMHMSTSPFYPMFASLDVGAQMMKGKNGFFLWDDCIRLGIELRKKIRNLAAEFLENETDPRRQWFVDPFVPDLLSIKGSAFCGDKDNVKWEDIPTDVIAQEQQCWMFNEGASWHGYKHIKQDYVMVDPTKMLLLTPGINRKTGEYEEWGIPATLLGAYLRDRGIVCEKTDFNSILFLLTPALEKCKAGTLLAELMRFKKMIDDDVTVKEMFPKIVAEFPETYENRTIQDLAQEMHNLYKKHDARALQMDQFKAEHFPELAMTPQDAFEELMRNHVDYLPIEKIKGRIAATLALVYPPGIGVIMPGERYDEAATPQRKYFEMFEKTAEFFPGFENEIQGMYLEKNEDGTESYYTYVVKEEDPS